jgi:hypothetical protein
MTGEAELAGILRRLHDDRWVAHRYLFAHRHPNESPKAHRDLVEAINSPKPRLSIEGFRGVAKTTYTEETALLKAVFREFHNLVIIGPSFPRACERVDAIANEIDVNPYFDDKDGLFGPLRGDARGDTWGMGKIVLAGNICIQALGRDQAITGLKFRQWRPDAFLIDDIEDPEEKRNDAEREETWRWLKQTFQPSLDDPLFSWGRFLGTRRGSSSLPERLEKDGVPTVKFPIESIGEAGERIATWPAKFPLAKIDLLKFDYRGDMDLYYQEYMCQATSSTDRVFRREMFRYEDRIKSWEAVFAFVDPARTEHGKAASTGWSVWSWVKNRLIVWASGSEFIAPDAVVALIFDIVERYDPVWIYAEPDGLVQWLMQPIRHEQIRRGHTIPVKFVPAITGTKGRGQTGFIASMQGLFVNHEVIFVQEMPALESQLLSFPHGIRDTANSLAYAQTTKPALPIYDGFDPETHIALGIEIAAGQRLMLAANATGAMTTAVLVQAFERRLCVLADWVFEGSPGERAVDIAEAAAQAIDSSRFVAVRVDRPWDDALKLPAPDRMLARPNRPAWVVPQLHSDRYMNVGLMQAVRAVPGEVRAGGMEVKGRLHLADALSRTVRGIPCVQISPNARWTLRALAGGYTRPLVRGQLQDEAEAGPYRVLMEGLEAFCALIGEPQVDSDEDAAQNFRIDERTGRRYASAMPERIR